MSAPQIARGDNQIDLFFHCADQLRNDAGDGIAVQRELDHHIPVIVVLVGIEGGYTFLATETMLPAMTFNVFSASPRRLEKSVKGDLKEPGRGNILRQCSKL